MSYVTSIFNVGIEVVIRDLYIHNHSFSLRNQNSKSRKEKKKDELITTNYLIKTLGCHHHHNSKSVISDPIRRGKNMQPERTLCSPSSRSNIMLWTHHCNNAKQIGKEKKRKRVPCPRWRVSNPYGCCVRRPLPRWMPCRHCPLCVFLTFRLVLENRKDSVLCYSVTEASSGLDFGTELT